MLRFYLNTLALERSCLMHIMSMEYADLCFVYDFFYCNTTFLFDHHDHSLKLKEQPVYVTHLLKLD